MWFEFERSNFAARGQTLQRSIEYNVDRACLGATEDQKSMDTYEKENPEEELVGNGNVLEASDS